MERCKNVSRYRGIMKPRCNNGRGCKACWDIYYAKKLKVK